MGSLLTVREAAAEAGRSRSTLFRLVESGDLPATKLAGRTGAWVIDSADLAEYLARAEPERDRRCPHCIDHPGWATGDVRARREPADVCRHCLGSGINQQVCDGSSRCASGAHEHGCFADLDGPQCADPDDHPNQQVPGGDQ